MTVSEQIIAEASKRPGKMDDIDYGRVSFVIQDGKLVRVEIQDGWKPEKEKIKAVRKG